MFFYLKCRLKVIENVEKCINLILEVESTGKCSQITYIGKSLKEIASGGEDKKTLFKEKYSE